SRAARTEIIRNSVQDGPNGSASYLVDLPNGGSALISGKVFEKGPHSSNKQTAISIGAEKEITPPGDIVVENNSFSNDPGTAAAFVRHYPVRPIVLTRNRFSGSVTPLRVSQPVQGDPKRP